MLRLSCLLTDSAALVLAGCFIFSSCFPLVPLWMFVVWSSGFVSVASCLSLSFPCFSPAVLCPKCGRYSCRCTQVLPNVVPQLFGSSLCLWCTNSAALVLAGCFLFSICIPIVPLWYSLRVLSQLPPGCLSVFLVSLFFSGCVVSQVWS